MVTFRDRYRPATQQVNIDLPVCSTDWEQLVTLLPRCWHDMLLSGGDDLNLYHCETRLACCASLFNNHKRQTHNLFQLHGWSVMYGRDFGLQMTEVSAIITKELSVGPQDQDQHRCKSFSLFGTTCHCLSVQPFQLLPSRNTWRHISLTWPFPLRHWHTRWPIDAPELFHRFCCCAQIRLSRHWAWLREGYWRDRTLIDCLIIATWSYQQCSNIIIV